jgi:hypothetical protein
MSHYCCSNIKIIVYKLLTYEISLNIFVADGDAFIIFLESLWNMQINEMDMEYYLSLLLNLTCIWIQNSLIIVDYMQNALQIIVKNYDYLWPFILHRMYILKSKFWCHRKFKFYTNWKYPKLKNVINKSQLHMKLSRQNCKFRLKLLLIQRNVPTLSEIKSLCR